MYLLNKTFDTIKHTSFLRNIEGYLMLTWTEKKASKSAPFKCSSLQSSHNKETSNTSLTDAVLILSGEIIYL